MRLFQAPVSSCARRAVMTAIHLHADVDLVEVNLMKPEDRALLASMNPNVKVPILEDDGFVLWESHAIMQYIAERTPGQTLYPTDARARADVNRWLFWSSQHWGPAIGVLNFQHFIKKIIGQGDADPAEVARGEREVTQFATVLDRHLHDREWISGKTLTLADFSIAAQLMTIVPAKLPVAPYANIHVWFARMRALPAWQKTDL